MNTTDEALAPHGPKRVIIDYLLQHSNVFRDLDEVRRRGWANLEGDEHFRRQRQRADKAGPVAQRLFFGMMCRLGDGMQEHTGAIAFAKSAPSVLDLCAAPGGFIATALKYNPTATVCGISLPPDLGGHALLHLHGDQDSRVSMQFLDITTLGSEFGLDLTECTTANLSHDRPYLDRTFDLVFCDGQVLRTQTNVPEDKRGLEPQRLACSQLILAMQRINDGGTLIMLLHKVEEWHTLQILHAFSRFADIQLYKPKKTHATRSSFYMIATNVRPSSVAGLFALAEWKTTWKDATIEIPKESAGEDTSIHEATEPDVEEMRKVLEESGGRVIQLAEPIWIVQKKALSKQSWTK